MYLYHINIFIYHVLYISPHGPTTRRGDHKEPVQCGLGSGRRQEPQWLKPRHRNGLLASLLWGCGGAWACAGGWKVPARYSRACHSGVATVRGTSPSGGGTGLRLLFQPTGWAVVQSTSWSLSEGCWKVLLRGTPLSYWDTSTLTWVTTVTPGRE